MWKCMHCGKEAVTWIRDTSYDDLYMQGQGMMSLYECNHCGAVCELYVTTGFDEEEEAVSV